MGQWSRGRGRRNQTVSNARVAKGIEEACACVRVDQGHTVRQEGHVHGLGEWPPCSFAIWSFSRISASLNAHRTMELSLPRRP